MEKPNIIMSIPTADLIPPADRAVLAAAEQRREARLAKRRAQAAKRRLDPAYVQHVRAYNRQYRLEHLDVTNANQRKYQRSEKGRATRAAWDQRVHIDGLRQRLNDWLALNPESLTMHNKPIKSPHHAVNRGRPAWIKAIAAEHGLSLQELRQISRSLAKKREAERELAELADKITTAKKA